MNLRQAAQQALEALEGLADYRYTERVKNTMASLRAALAEPEQDPFGDDAERYARKLHEEREAYKALFTAPTPRKPLTDEEIVRICVECWRVSPRDIFFARAIERAHSIGEQT